MAFLGIGMELIPEATVSQAATSQGARQSTARPSRQGRHVEGSAQRGHLEIPARSAREPSAKCRPQEPIRVRSSFIVCNGQLKRGRDCSGSRGGSKDLKSKEKA